MARLNENVKAYIVQRLACFATPTEVVGEVKEIYGLELSRQHVHYYDPDAPASKAPKKWRVLHVDTRKAYLKAKAGVGIANERWRMEQRQLLYERAGTNTPLRLSILEQAEKAEGGAFTNRHKIQHTGQVKTSGVLVLPSTPDNWSKQAREQQRALDGEAARAADAAARG